MSAKLHVTFWAALAALMTFFLADPAPLPLVTDFDPQIAGTEELGGKDRFLTHLSTDKPIYKTGEPVYLRAVLLHAVTHKPLQGTLRGRLEIKGPKGDTVGSGLADLADGVLGFRWQVPDGMPGGRYRARVSYDGQLGGYAPAERSFDIRAYRAPRFKTQIEFVRDGYGPGDRVSATCRVERAEGGVPAGADVTVMARVDGHEIFRETLTVDDGGDVGTAFRLPDDLERGEGVLLFAIRDGGFSETASKTIPILVQTLELNCFPEGGDLVAGLSNQVYIEVRTPAGKPADIQGILLDDRDRQVAAFATRHEGRGLVTFVPAADRRYHIRVVEPAGIAAHFPLPAVKNRGAVLHALDAVTEPGKPVQLQIGSPFDANVFVTLTRLERRVAVLPVAVKAGRMRRISLPTNGREGVLTATVWSEDGRPLAERLVFCRPAGQIGVDISFDQNNAVPGESVALTVRTIDQCGLPVGAVVGLTVTDESVLEMVETREQAPRLPVMVLLENEVRDLADAQVYLDPLNPEAPDQLDLLLGTQGWRRFALSDWSSFLALHGDEARRALAQRVVPVAYVPERRSLVGAVHEMLAGAINGPKDASPPLPAPMMEQPEERDGAAENAIGGAPPVDEPVAVDGEREAEFEEKAAVAGAELRQDVLADRDFRGDDKLEEFGRLAKRQQVAETSLHFREYAHDLRPDRQPGQRRDFTETLFWHAALRTDDRTGTATVRFALNDAVTSFRASADAFTKAGELGSGQATIAAVQPFFLEPKLPLQVTGGDEVTLPIGLVNNTLSPLQGKVTVRLAGIEVGVFDFAAGADSRVRRTLDLRIDGEPGERDLVIDAVAGAFRDRVTRTLHVVPRGFPVERHFGGTLSAVTPLSFSLEIPEQMVPGSLIATGAAYPSPLASLTDALEALIREPHGCFEQTSSTSYPLVMAQGYFTTHQGVDPELIARAKKNLDLSYTRLTGFECAKQGYEWFGGDPGHEALTAYGLMQFADMRAVRPVDAAMLDRTRAWLLGRRDGKGGFQRNPRALDSFGGAPQETTDAYITWALSEAGTPGLEREVDHMRVLGRASDDSYILALAANVMFLAGDRESGVALLARLASRQQPDGHITGASTSITRSGGDSLEMETTALGLLAWMRDAGYAGNVEKGMGYLAERCKGGRFGSTQATVLALRAIVTYDRLRARPRTGGAISLTVDGRPVGEPVVFQAGHEGTIDLPDFSAYLGPGRHRIGLSMSDGGAMPVSLTAGFHTLKPDSSERCQPRLQTRLAQARLTEGDITEIAVRVSNPGTEAIPTPVAVIGLPGGLEPRLDRLQELVDAGTLDAYEILDGQVICYWRYLAGERTVSFNISAVAAVPGTYTGAAGRTYAYYTDEDKDWVAGSKVTIDPN